MAKISYSLLRSRHLIVLLLLLLTDYNRFLRWVPFGGIRFLLKLRLKLLCSLHHLFTKKLNSNNVQNTWNVVIDSFTMKSMPKSTNNLASYIVKPIRFLLDWNWNVWFLPPIYILFLLFPLTRFLQFGFGSHSNPKTG